MGRVERKAISPEANSTASAYEVCFGSGRICEAGRFLSERYVAINRGRSNGPKKSSSVWMLYSFH